MKTSKRKFISIYFEDSLIDKRKKRDFTIAFSLRDPAYNKCKKMGSTEIKKVIGIFSYKQLLEKANEDGRSLNNFIKHILNKKLGKR